MSSANTEVGRGRTERTLTLPSSAPSLGTLVRTPARWVRALAFWLAVAMAPAHLAMLFSGPVAVADLPLVAALVCGNVLTLVAGHGYGADVASGGRD